MSFLVDPSAPKYDHAGSEIQLYGVKSHSAVVRGRRLAAGRPGLTLGVSSGPPWARLQMLHLACLNGSPGRFGLGWAWAGSPVARFLHLGHSLARLGPVINCSVWRVSMAPPAGLGLGWARCPSGLCPQCCWEATQDPRVRPGSEPCRRQKNFSFLVDPSAPKYHNAGPRNGVMWCRMALWSGLVATPSPR